MYDKLRIDTTQNVTLDIEKAGLGDRLLAFFIDELIIIAYVIACFLFLNKFLYEDFIDIFTGSNLKWTILVTIPITCYHLFFEYFREGQSPGKIFIKIKVVKLDGGELSFGSLLIRTIFRIIDFSPLLLGSVGIISIASTKNSQRLGDLLAGTTVIKVKDRVRLEDTIYTELEPNYIPKFPQVTILTPKDIEIIKQVLNKKNYRNNPAVISKLHVKLIDILKIDSNLSPMDLLKVIVKDYYFYA